LTEEDSARFTDARTATGHHDYLIFKLAHARPSILVRQSSRVKADSEWMPNL
jgi:hypothetical protein